jgi:hypothetical protein
MTAAISNALQVLLVPLHRALPAAGRQEAWAEPAQDQRAPCFLNFPVMTAQRQ